MSSLPHPTLHPAGDPSLPGPGPPPSGILDLLLGGKGGGPLVRLESCHPLCNISI